MRTLPTNDIIREVLGENHPIALGWQVLVETYNFGDHFVNEDGSNSVFERPDSCKNRDMYQVGVGRVLMIGKSAFKGSKFEYWEDIIPEVGDYVSFPKYEGSMETYAGKQIQYLNDYTIRSIHPDPKRSSYFHFVGN